MTLRNLYIKGGETRSIVEETNLFDYLFFAINQDNLPIPLLREIVSTIYLIFTESKAQPLIIAKVYIYIYSIYCIDWRSYPKTVCSDHRA